MSWAYVPESAELNSDYTLLPTDRQTLSALLSETDSVSVFCKHGSQELQSGMTSQPLTPQSGPGKSIASLQDSRANHAVKQASKNGKMTRDGSGLLSKKSFATFDLDTYSWKMCQGCLWEDLMPSFLVWPPAGSMRSGVCFPVQCSEQTTVDKGFLCIAESGYWPTPLARDWRNGKSKVIRNSRPLCEQACRFGHPDKNENIGPESPKNTGRLNCYFVEWLMGFPDGWTQTEKIDLRPWETQCLHLLRHTLGEF